ncbi:MAG: 50S ribosomal protein L30 [Methanomassiliicoccales archaeon]|nr:50S ribosomal protein L30 [Methanomassiliicoccales archaeon]TFG57218.1 MAG: 50S ribosomal protein L30 [Methanomassiliicoccus sp.]
MAYAAIRIRGHSGVKGDIEDTMLMLRLTRANHCVVLQETPEIKGMLMKAKDYITWGEVSEETLARMIKFRGRLIGDKPIDDEVVKESTPFGSIMAFAKGVSKGETKYSEMKDVKPLFRLSPPRKGYEGVKRGFGAGGALGYRGEEINDLISRMI